MQIEACFVSRRCPEVSCMERALHLGRYRTYLCYPPHPVTPKMVVYRVHVTPEQFPTMVPPTIVGIPGGGG